MVLVRDRRAEQREDAVAGALHDVAVVAAHRVDHQLERRVDNRARFFGIEILFELGRALDVREQRGDRLALAFEIFRVRASLLLESVNRSISLPTQLEVAQARAAHSPQKSSPGSFEAPHCGHTRASGAAHFAQNLRPSRLSAPHFAQFIATHLSSSSSALASFRSAVSKPSVNQL